MRFGDLVEELAARLAAGRAFFGHGQASAWDEALRLATFVCRAGHWQRAALMQRRVSRAEQARARGMARTRVSRRIPLAYLTREAWFAGLRFEVDKRVCIPRSPLAELIEDGFAPWIKEREPRRILELCTGSGCIAAACAAAFPGSEVVATDISTAALHLAARNIKRLGLARRVQLLEGDLFAGAEGRFDLVVANPPYVPTGICNALPKEYRHEPRMALESGADGLAAAERILRAVPAYLAAQGLLVLELGEVADEFAARHPELPFVWPDMQSGGSGVLLLSGDSLSFRG
ncbi:50S ribosomal protein L3 N(5)-glutamine methyltransferase [Candidatus Foliamicus sp.]